MLDADGEADGASADAGRGELGVVHLRVRGGRGVDDERLDIRDVREEREEFQVVDEAERRLLPAHDVKGEDRYAALREVPLVDGVIGMMRERGVVDALDFRMLREEVHDLQCVRYVPLDAQGECLKPLQEEECVERSDRRARVAQEEGTDVGDEGDGAECLDEVHAVIAFVRLREVREASRCLPVEGAALDDDAAEAGAVPADEFRRGVHDDVRAVLDGAQEVRRREGVVDDDGDALRVCCLGDGLDVHEVSIRVADGLDEDAFRVRTDGVGKALCARLRLDEGHVDAPVLRRVREEVVGAAIDGLLRNDVVPRMGECLDRRRDRRCARGKGECRRAALECRDALFKDVLRRIHQASVDVARILECKAVGSVLRIVEDVRGRLIDRYGTRIRHGISFLLSDAHLQGLKTIFLLTHGDSPLTQNCITYFIDMYYI